MNSTTIFNVKNGANFKVFYTTIFDDIILKQLKKSGKDAKLKEILSKMLDKIEELGPMAGKLLDSRLHLFEVKNNKPAIRLYYKIVEEKKEAYIFEFEIKKSQEKQQTIIEKIKGKILET